METVNQVLQFMGDIVARVGKMDPANLVWLLAILLGYVLKWIGLFPNRFIPLTSLVVTVSCYVAMVHVPNAPMRQNVTDFVLGILFWGFAWALHAVVLKKFIDEKLLKGSNGNTAFIPKDNNEPKP